ncbi:MAG: trypsin-like serine protease with C-terminal domain [Clostridia bacterium]|nr:trypsin-like serine protease with C-terminal domain [Clostridia bacterium]
MQNKVRLRIIAFLMLIAVAFPQITYAFNYDSQLDRSIILYIGSSKAYVNNIEKAIDANDKAVTPIVQQNRTLLPVRFVSENIGATVTWDQASKIITISHGTDTIEMQLNSKIMYKNGTMFTSDIAPYVKNNRTFVPIRVLSESLGKNVFYDRSVIIISDRSTQFDTQADKAVIDSIIKNYTSTQKLSVEEISTYDKSVVVVYTLDQNGSPIAQGSGFYVGPGVILTNFHVIEGASRIIIETEDNRKLDVEGIFASDVTTDLAMLKLKTNPNLPVLKLGFDKILMKGQQIVTISSPEGLKNSISEGIISGLRNEAGVELVQISAPITHGSSGSPLFDMYGDVIGINSAGLDTGNLNFAISINHAQDWLKRISGAAFASIPTIGKEQYVKDSRIPDTEVKNVLNSMVKSFNDENLAAYLNSFYYKDSTLKAADSQVLSAMFHQYDLLMKIQNYRIIKKTDAETLIRVTTSFESKGYRMDYGKTTISNLYYLKKYGSLWKIYKVDTEFIVSVEEPSGYGSTPAPNDAGHGMFEPISSVKTSEIKDIDVKMSIDNFKYNQGNNKIYALNKTNRKLIVIDAANKSVEKIISLTNRPGDISISKDNRMLYIVNEDVNTITEIRLSDYFITRDLEWKGVNLPSEDRHFHLEYYDNKLYLIDQNWAPSLWVLDLKTLKTIDYGQNNNSPSPAQNKIDNVGDFAINDNTGDIYFWQQYGWDAGYAGSDLFRYERTAEGYQKIDNADFTYADLKRDPQDAPVMLVEDKGWIITKTIVANMNSLRHQYYKFDEEVYAVDSKGLYAVSKKNVYSLSEFDKLGTVPLQNADFYFFDNAGSLYMVDNKTSTIKYCTIQQ